MTRRDRLALTVLLCDLRDAARSDAQMITDLAYIMDVNVRLVPGLGPTLRGLLISDPGRDRHAWHLLRVRVALYVRVLVRASTPPDLEWGYDDTAAFGAHAEICTACGWRTGKPRTQAVADCTAKPTRTRRTWPLWESAPPMGHGKKTPVLPV